MSEIIHGDCLNEMHDLPEDSVDSVVTDPPYGLSFMGRSWDQFKPKEYQKFSNKWGEEALRALKPGGYLLAFSGTRTYHRMVCGLEDAGFEIKDQIDWLYGSGFPKSHDISKAIDNHFDEGREIVGESPNSRDGYEGREDEDYSHAKKITVTKPATSEARKWNGYGTALKPAHELIVLAQKPREGTYAENVLEHGVGGLNIDGCRIEANDSEWVRDRRNEPSEKDKHSYEGGWRKVKQIGSDKGRWPANVILDPSAAAILDGQSGETSGTGGEFKDGGDLYGLPNNPSGYDDSGGASRFFYCAKAHKSERNAGLEDSDIEEREKRVTNMQSDSGMDWRIEDGEITNPKAPPKKVKNDIATLKPINLMRWLVRLVTPPGGTVLDPFAGSGTTGCACEIEGFDYILIEKRERFAKVIAPKRIEYWSKEENWSELKDHEELEDPQKRKTASLEQFGGGE